jgi:hypothetical protein
LDKAVMLLVELRGKIVIWANARMTKCDFVLCEFRHCRVKICFRRNQKWKEKLFNVVCGGEAQTVTNRIGWLAAMTVLMFGLITGCQYESAALSVSRDVKDVSFTRNAEKTAFVGIFINGFVVYLAGLNPNTTANSLHGVHR